jgi:hypothetical protein
VTGPSPSEIRYRVDPADVPPEKAAGEWFRISEDLMAVAQAPYYALYRPGGLVK